MLFLEKSLQPLKRKHNKKHRICVKGWNFRQPWFVLSRLLGERKYITMLAVFCFAVLSAAGTITGQQTLALADVSLSGSSSDSLILDPFLSQNGNNGPPAHIPTIPTAVKISADPDSNYQNLSKYGSILSITGGHAFDSGFPNQGSPRLNPVYHVPFPPGGRQFLNDHPTFLENSLPSPSPTASDDPSMTQSGVGFGRPLEPFVRPAFQLEVQHGILGQPAISNIRDGYAETDISSPNHSDFSQHGGLAVLTGSDDEEYSDQRDKIGRIILNNIVRGEALKATYEHSKKIIYDALEGHRNDKPASGNLARPLVHRPATGHQAAEHHGLASVVHHGHINGVHDGKLPHIHHGRPHQKLPLGIPPIFGEYQNSFAQSSSTTAKPFAAKEIYSSVSSGAPKLNVTSPVIVNTSTSTLPTTTTSSAKSTVTSSNSSTTSLATTEASVKNSTQEATTIDFFNLRWINRK